MLMIITIIVNKRAKIRPIELQRLGLFITMTYWDSISCCSCMHRLQLLSVYFSSDTSSGIRNP